MRAGRAEIVAAVLTIALTTVSYSYVGRLLQGRTVERLWTDWMTSDRLLLKDLVTPYVLVLMVLCVMILFFAKYGRRFLWNLSVRVKVPEPLTLTWPARIVERFLTNDHKLQRHALSYLPRDTRALLDIGCGGATYLGGLPHVYKIGIDMNPRRLKVAKKHCDRVVHDNCLYHGINAYRVDAVLCFEVIEHLSETEGHRLLDKLAKFPTVVLTTPREYFTVARNGREQHKSFWSQQLLLTYGFELQEEIDVPPSNIYVRRA
jgi:hypothetical protein